MHSNVDSIADSRSAAQLIADGSERSRSTPRLIVGPNRQRERAPDGAGRTTGERARRALNFVAAFVLLVLASPLMLVLAFLVKATSPGPVLYRQPRVGLDRRDDRDRRGPTRPTDGRRRSDEGGVIFSIYKFRTMYASVGDEPQVWASEGDPRITPIGDVLRRYRLDELPQLFNILKGDMNLVGPRPEQPVIFSELRGQIDSYPVRQKVLPGITGWAQVNQAYDQNLDDVRRKVSLDLEYLQRKSVSEDLKIMVRTLPVMVFKKGSM